MFTFSLEKSHFNTLRPRQNGCHFPDNISKCIFKNENVWIVIDIALKFVLKGPFNKIPALVQIVAFPYNYSPLLQDDNCKHSICLISQSQNCAKLGKLAECDQNLINTDSGKDTSLSQISGYSFHPSPK